MTCRSSLVCDSWLSVFVFGIIALANIFDARSVLSTIDWSSKRNWLRLFSYFVFYWSLLNKISWKKSSQFFFFFSPLKFITFINTAWDKFVWCIDTYSFVNLDDVHLYLVKLLLLMNLMMYQYSWKVKLSKLYLYKLNHWTHVSLWILLINWLTVSETALDNSILIWKINEILSSKLMIFEQLRKREFYVKFS
jgi:hypothetical protein